ncbi:MAG TPA: hypothetical protein VF209_03575 [Patescibacteria group bacterium]
MVRITYFTTRRWYGLVFICILVIAVFLRFYKLGQVPAGMTWDEAAIGYNGFAIWETRRDEWLQLLPVSFRSFGDYKAPLAIYVNGLFTLLFGLNLTAIRIPFALAGSLAVAGFGLLIRTLWRETSSKNSLISAEAASLVGMSVIALSPWHLHFSRVGFESGMALAEILWAVYFLLSFFLIKHSKMVKNASLLLSVLLFALSFYTYHSAKIVTPLLVVMFAVRYREQMWQEAKSMLAGGILGCLLLLPLIKDSLFDAGAERFQQASLFGMDIPATELLAIIGQNFLLHFSPHFLILGATETLRHGSGAWGVLLPTTFVLVVLSLLSVINHRHNPTHLRLWQMAFWWLVIGIIPAAIGRDVPHSNRALLALPGFILLALEGAEWCLQWIKNTAINLRVLGNHGEKNVILKLVIGYLILLHCFFFFKYSTHYYSVFAQASTQDFQEGYQAMLEYVIPYENGEQGRPEVSKIRISDEYGQPYIYALLARQTNPIWYQGGSLIKYEFADVEIGDLLRENAIIVGSARDKDDLPFERADKLIYGSDGSIRFAIFVTDNSE